MSLKSAKQSVLAGGRCKSRARERRLGMLSKGHGNKPGARRGPHIGDWNSLQEAKGEVRKESDATVVSEISKLRLGKAPGRLRAHTGGGKQGASCSVSRFSGSRCFHLPAGAECSSNSRLRAGETSSAPRESLSVV